MAAIIDSNNLHRTAKYFMDSGQAETHEEAMALLMGFGITIYVGNEIGGSVHQQMALLSLINCAGRTLLGGVEVIGLPDVPSISPLAPTQSLREAARELGARLANTAKHEWPSAVIGNATVPVSGLPSWRLTWSGWRGGVIPARDGRRLSEDYAMALAPLAAAASCAAEVFAHHAKDHVMAGRRPAGMSLWRPGTDWLVEDHAEPRVAYLPSRPWLIGLGHLGQAFAWALASLSIWRSRRGSAYFAGFRQNIRLE